MSWGSFGTAALSRPFTTSSSKFDEQGRGWRARPSHLGRPLSRHRHGVDLEAIGRLGMLIGASPMRQCGKCGGAASLDDDNRGRHRRLIRRWRCSLNYPQTSLQHGGWACRPRKLNPGYFSQVYFLPTSVSRPPRRTCFRIERVPRSRFFSILELPAKLDRGRHRHLLGFIPLVLRLSISKGFVSHTRVGHPSG